MKEIFELLEMLVKEIPDTIEKDGQLYKIQLVPVEKEELVETKEMVDKFNKMVDSIDPEIWEIAIKLFSEKYNAKLFDRLINSKRLTKDEFSQLTNAINAFERYVIDATNVRINYLTDKYINGFVQNTTKD